MSDEATFVKGIDPVRDIRVCLPGFEPRVVFDVGANVGQSAATFVEAFPEAEIHCFEPVAETFRELAERFAASPRVRCTCSALGAASGTAAIRVGGGSTQASLLATSRLAGPDSQATDVETLDDVCAARGIGEIDLLKVDTEGFDLEVLRGARRMLAEQSIGLLEAEAGMNPENELHVPFDTLKTFLEGFGYRLFGIYEQKEEWPTREPHLRRTNPLFISHRLIDRFRGHDPGSPP